MITFLHIPKTGCTSIKYALIEQPSDLVKVHPREGHDTHIRKLGNDIALIVRDPWQRFCSAFWERKTTLQRKQISESMNVEKFGYMNYRPYEKNIIAQMNTPEEFFLWAHDNSKAYRKSYILYEITKDLSTWLGNKDMFIKHEHKIAMAFNIGNLTAIMDDQFGIRMPQDPFRKRSRELFDFEQSYDISSENLEKFKHWRNVEYDLVDHIRQRHYYITP